MRFLRLAQTLTWIGFLLQKAGAEVAIADNGQRALHMALEARDAGRSFDADQIGQGREVSG